MQYVEELSKRLDMLVAQHKACSSQKHKDKIEYWMDQVRAELGKIFYKQMNT